MPWVETFRVAWRSVKANKMRSFLTMLGIIIGVASVIVMSAVGAGATSSVTQKVEGLGSNLLTVMPGASTYGGVNRGEGSASTLTYADANAIASEDPDVAAVAPVENTGGQVVFQSNNMSTAIQGTTSSYLQIKSATFAEGRFFQPQEVTDGSNVAVLGSQVAQTLFTGTGVDPVGQTIDINQIPFTVIGVLNSLGSNGFQNLDDEVTVPITTMMNLFTGSQKVSSIIVSAKSQSVMNQAQQQVEATLRNQHQLAPGQSDDFTIQNQATILDTLSSVSTTLTFLLAGIAGISLLVGGIGIMNIMLVSVTERTREIGIRKAVGAKRIVILSQFLVEALILSLSGGILGVVIGGGGALLASSLMQSAATISLWSVLLAVGFAMLVGIVFGVYPARKAANLKPIDALRYE